MKHFYKEAKTGNIYLGFEPSADAAPVQLEQIKANTTDAAQEKHVPVIAVTGNKVMVSVGSVSHPMLEEHFITGISIETKLGGQFRKLLPGEAPKAEFLLAEGDELIAAYEYCNLHGLWKAES